MIIIAVAVTYTIPISRDVPLLVMVDADVVVAVLLQLDLVGFPHVPTQVKFNSDALLFPQYPYAFL